jgi:hypothetical protein
LPPEGKTGQKNCPSDKINYPQTQGESRHGLGQQSHPRRQLRPRPRSALRPQRRGHLQHLDCHLQPPQGQDPPARRWKTPSGTASPSTTAWPRSQASASKKGRPVYVEGRLKYGKYTDKDGIERNTVDIVATEMQLLGGREGVGGWAPMKGGSRVAPRAQRARRALRRHRRPSPLPSPASGFDDMDDDIPF